MPQHLYPVRWNLRQVIPHRTSTASAIVHLSLLALLLLFCRGASVRCGDRRDRSRSISSRRRRSPSSRAGRAAAAQNKPTAAAGFLASRQVRDDAAPAAVTPPTAPPQPSKPRATGSRRSRQGSSRRPRSRQAAAPAAAGAAGAGLHAARAGRVGQISGAARPAAGSAADAAGVARQAPDKARRHFDAPATDSRRRRHPHVVAEFRRHLRTCSKLPASMTRLRRRQGQAARVHDAGRQARGRAVLIEASASTKGPPLMQGAISALQACQPYAMLPADRYGEWKVLDLSFTPQDFASGASWMVSSPSRCQAFEANCRRQVTMTTARRGRRTAPRG